MQDIPVTISKTTVDDYICITDIAAAKSDNVRDFATIHELTVLSNLETHNADMIRDGISKQKRFEKLQALAKYQLTILHEADKLHLPEKST